MEGQPTLQEHAPLRPVTGIRLRVEIPQQPSARYLIISAKPHETIREVANHILLAFKQLFVTKFKNSKELTVKSLEIEGYYMSKYERVGDLLESHDRVVCHIGRDKSKGEETKRQDSTSRIHNNIQNMHKENQMNQKANSISFNVDDIDNSNNSRKRQILNQQDVQKQDNLVKDYKQRDNKQKQSLDSNQGSLDHLQQKNQTKKERIKQKKKTKELAKRIKQLQEQQNLSNEKGRQKINNLNPISENQKQDAMDIQVNEQLPKLVSRGQIHTNIEEHPQISNITIKPFKSGSFDSKPKVKKDKLREAQNLRLGYQRSQQKSQQKVNRTASVSLSQPKSNLVVLNKKEPSPKISASPKITFYSPISKPLSNPVNKQTPKQGAQQHIQAPSKYNTKISEEFSLNKRQQPSMPGQSQQQQQTSQHQSTEKKSHKQDTKIIREGEFRKKIVVESDSSGEDEQNPRVTNTSGSEREQNPYFHQPFKEMKDIEEYMKKYHIQVSDSQQY